MNWILKYGPIKAVLSLVSILLVLLPSAISAGYETVDENIAYQSEHMRYLKEEYYTDSYVPCDESKIAAFDISQAIASGVRYNEVAFLGTHNSYKIGATEQYKKLYDALDVATFGIIGSETADFAADTLTQQLELGIRNLEIDIETVVSDSGADFVVSHIPYLDNVSSCYDLALALSEIKLWSDNNPGHLPVSVIIEPKKAVVPVGGMRGFNIDYANELDALVRNVLGETLLTPKEMMGEYSSFKEMRENDGWLPLGDTMGKVLVLLHDCSATDKFIKQDETIKSRAMFPVLRYNDRNERYTSFILDNEPDTALKHEKESIDKCNLIVRTRADSFPDFSEERYELINKCRSQIVSSDYVVKYGETPYHTFSFDGYTVKLVK
ncbi:MAG: hypothetical protein IJW86_08220 [Clostridia bacterium]|nr:hypothetical protein [Clostridia bacterium]